MPTVIYFGDNLPILQSLPSESVDLIYIDPPFNTGKNPGPHPDPHRTQRGWDRWGFQGQRYQTIKLGSKGYADIFDDFLAFLAPRLRRLTAAQTRRQPVFHIDYREVHYCKVLLDQIFGRESFINRLSGPTTTAESPKPAGLPSMITSCSYVQRPGHYTFNVDAIEREPYMLPAGRPEKAARASCRQIVILKILTF